MISFLMITTKLKIEYIIYMCTDFNLPGLKQERGTVYCPIKSSPMNSSSKTAILSKANSGTVTVNSKLSSKAGECPKIY